MPNPTPCQLVTTITETSAATPLPCQLTVGRLTEARIWLRTPSSGSNSRRKMISAATPDTTTGR